MNDIVNGCKWQFWDPFRIILLGFLLQIMQNSWFWFLECPSSTKGTGVLKPCQGTCHGLLKGRPLSWGSENATENEQRWRLRLGLQFQVLFGVTLWYVKDVLSVAVSKMTIQKILDLLKWWYFPQLCQLCPGVTSHFFEGYHDVGHTCWHHQDPPLDPLSDVLSPMLGDLSHQSPSQLLSR